MTTRRMRLTAALLGIALAGAALAQDDKRASRERESLRRAQQALRVAQEQQSTLQREKLALAVERDKAEEAARTSGSQLGAVQAQANRIRGELSRLQAEQASLRSELEALRSGSAQREQAQQARIEELTKTVQDQQRLLAERTQTVTTLSTLLERSTQALAGAEANNRELYAVGRRLIDELRRFGGGEGLIGLDSVRLENRAEALRSEIEAQRMVSGAPRP